MDYREGFWVIMFLLKEEFNMINNRGKVLFAILDSIDENNSTGLITSNSRLSFVTVKSVIQELHKEGIVDIEYINNKNIVTFNPLFIENALKWRKQLIEKLKNEN